MKYTSYTKLKGFSLVEMLVVIAVIGIISAVAIPSISKINEASKEATNKRNAQNLATVAGAASAAGLDFVAPDDIEQTLQNVRDGGEVADGVYEGSYFGVPSLSDFDLDGAQTFLRLQDGFLVYALEEELASNNG